MKYLYSLFLIFILTVCVSATEITVSAFNNTQYQYGGSTATIRVYLSDSLITSDNKILIAGRPGSSGWYKQISCTVSGSTLSCPQFILDSTTDSSVPNAFYTLQIYDENGRNRRVFAILKVPDTNTTTTLAALVLYSSTIAANLPTTYYTAAQIDVLLGSVNIANATTTVAGKVRLDTAPADPSIPIAVGVNSSIVSDVAANKSAVATNTSSISTINTTLTTKADLTAGKLIASQVPNLAISDYLGTAADETAMRNLLGDKGDWLIRTDQKKVYIVVDEAQETPNPVSDYQVFDYPIDTYTNVGTTGENIVKQVNNGSIEFKKIKAGSNITVSTTVNDEIEITGSAGAGGSTIHDNVVETEGQVDSLITTANGSPNTHYEIFVDADIVLANKQKTFPENTTVIFLNNSKFTETTDGSTITFNGEVIAPHREIFTDFEACDIKTKGSNSQVPAHWFGMVANDSGSTQRSKNNDAFEAFSCTYNEAVGGGTQGLAGSRWNVPNGDYYFAEPLEPTQRVWVEGTQFSTNTQGGARFYFPEGKHGIKLWYKNTGGSLVTDTNPSGSTFKNLSIIAEGFDGKIVDGIIYNTVFHGENLYSTGFSRNGFYSDTYTDDRSTTVLTNDSYYQGRNSNGSTCKNCYAYYNGVSFLTSGNLNQGSLTGTLTGANLVLSSAIVDVHSLRTLLKIKGAKRLNIENGYDENPVRLRLTSTFDYHGWGTDDEVTIAGTGTALDGNTYSIIRVDDDEISLQGTTDSTLTGNFTSTGTATGDLIAMVGDIVSTSEVRLVEEDTPFVTSGGGQTFDITNNHYETSENAVDTVNVTNAKVAILGAGYETQGTNSTNHDIGFFDATYNAGDGGKFYHQYNSRIFMHAQGNGRHPVNSGLPAASNAQGISQNTITLYSEGNHKNPVRFRGNGRMVGSETSEVGYTDDSSGVFQVENNVLVNGTSYIFGYTSATRSTCSGYALCSNTKILLGNALDFGLNANGVVPVSDADKIRIVGNSDSEKAEISIKGGAYMELIVGDRGSVTFDPSSINAITESKQTIAISDAQVGDTVTLTPPSLTSGLLVEQAHVSSAGTIEIRLYNRSGSAIDEPSGTWQYLLTR